jgi:hypothetical protein
MFVEAEGRSFGFHSIERGDTVERLQSHWALVGLVQVIEFTPGMGQAAQISLEDCYSPQFALNP